MNEQGLAPVEGVLIEGSQPIAVRGHIFQPVVLTHKPSRNGKAKPQIIRLSQREAKFIDRILQTGNLDIACKDIGITIQLGGRYLKRPNVRRYMDEKIREFALSNGTTIHNNLAWLREVRDGMMLATKEQLDASKVIARILRPAGVHLNLQQNFSHGTVPSPYQAMSFEQIIDETDERVNAIKGRSPSQA